MDKGLPPRLPSKKGWRTYRRWRGWPEPPEAEYTLDVRRLYEGQALQQSIQELVAKTAERMRF